MWSSHVMRKILCVTIAILFLSLGYIQVSAEEEKAIIVTYLHGQDTLKKMATKTSVETAEELASTLEQVTGALSNHNYAQALEFVYELTTDDVIPKNDIYHLIQSHFSGPYPGKVTVNSSALNLTNLLSFVFGYGNDGAFAYPLDLLAIFAIVVLFGWLPLGILLVFAYSYLWLVLSHLLPFRLLLPVTYLGIAEGELTFLGAKGITSIRPPTNDTVTALMLGFTGIVINIILPPTDDREAATPFFCLGYSLATFRVEKTL